MVGRIVVVAAFVGVAGFSAVNAQERPTTLAPGARVRFTLAEGPTRWQRGELDAVRNDSLVVFMGDSVAAYPLSGIARFQTRWRNKRSAITGAAIGAGVAYALAVGFTAAGSSDGVGFAAVGGLIGAAVGSGRRTRSTAVIGGAIGAASGMLIFGSTASACESGAGRDCSVIVGGVFGAITGLIVGSGVGMLLPNWVRMPLEGLRVTPNPNAGIRVGWSSEP